MAFAISFFLSRAHSATVEAFECEADTRIEYTIAEKKIQAPPNRKFSIPIIPGGRILVNRPEINSKIEIFLSDAISSRQSAINPHLAQQYIVHLLSDDRRYVHLDIVRKTKRRELVLSLKCERSH